jgi:hypothetical protein
VRAGGLGVGMEFIGLREVRGVEVPQASPSNVGG